tara:strand:- start:85 stop:279 length:195 start_codon:yes stop_codon:yes gene_type:complete
MNKTFISEFKATQFLNDLLSNPDNDVIYLLILDKEELLFRVICEEVYEHYYWEYQLDMEVLEAS